MLVTMKDILKRASFENYAVAAPNISSELDARAAIEVAEELNSPLILDVAYVSTPDLVFFGRYLTDLCRSSCVPIALNLDHGEEFSHAILAIRGGFTSIMVDRSTLTYEENVRQVKELVRIAHSVGVTVEAELGHVGQGTNYYEDRNKALTDPKQAKQYIEDTGIDCLAVAIGTAHGAYVGKPYLDFERLVDIKKETDNFPLVLHGGSGTGDENLKKACRLGINKVNVNNDLMRGACENIMSSDLSGNNAYNLWSLAKEGYKRSLKKMIEICGSMNKAWIPEYTGIQAGQIVMEEMRRENI